MFHDMGYWRESLTETVDRDFWNYFENWQDLSFYEGKGDVESLMWTNYKTWKNWDEYTEQVQCRTKISNPGSDKRSVVKAEISSISSSPTEKRYHDGDVWDYCEGPEESEDYNAWLEEEDDGDYVGLSCCAYRTHMDEDSFINFDEGQTFEYQIGYALLGEDGTILDWWQSNYMTGTAPYLSELTTYYEEGDPDTEHQIAQSSTNNSNTTTNDTTSNSTTNDTTSNDTISNDTTTNDNTVTDVLNDIIQA